MAVYKGKGLIVLMVPWVRVYSGRAKAWCQVARAAAESSQLDPQAGGREHTGNGRSLLKTQSPLPLTHLFQYSQNS